MTENGAFASDALMAILSAFSEACPRPTLDQVRDWTSRHPDQAAEIEAFAAASIVSDITSRIEPNPEDPSERPPRGYLERAFLQSRRKARPRSLADLAEAAGLTVSDLVERTGMKRSIIAKLDAGLVRGPVRGRLPTLLATILGVDRVAVEQAFVPGADEALAAASTSEHPALARQTFEEALRGAGLSETEVADWIAGD